MQVEWGMRQARETHCNPVLAFQNLEMHDRMEHLIEKQVSHGNFSTQTRAKTENLGR